MNDPLKQLEQNINKDMQEEHRRELLYRWLPLALLAMFCCAILGATIGVAFYYLSQ